jgi:hypothetical protein
MHTDTNTRSEHEKEENIQKCFSWAKTMKIYGCRSYTMFHSFFIKDFLSEKLSRHFHQLVRIS